MYHQHGALELVSESGRVPSSLNLDPNYEVPTSTILKAHQPVIGHLSAFHVHKRILVELVPLSQSLLSFCLLRRPFLLDTNALLSLNHNIDSDLGLSPWHELFPPKKS